MLVRQTGPRQPLKLQHASQDNLSKSFEMLLDKNICIRCSSAKNEQQQICFLNAERSYLGKNHEHDLPKNHHIHKHKRCDA